MSHEPFERTAEQAAASWLGRLLRSGLAASGAAWQASLARRVTVATASRAAAVGPERRLRLLALIVAWSCGWQLLLGPLIPRYAASALPWVWPAVAALIALAVAMAAGQLTRAWHSSVLRTVMVRLGQNE